MSSTKTPSCFRLCAESLMCLDRLEQSCGDYRSRTDIVEQAIIELYNRRLGSDAYEHNDPTLFGPGML